MLATRIRPRLGFAARPRSQGARGRRQRAAGSCCSRRTLLRQDRRRAGWPGAL